MEQIRPICPGRGLFYHPESDCLFQVTDPIELEKARCSIELQEVTGDQDWERRFLLQRSNSPTLVA